VKRKIKFLGRNGGKNGEEYVQISVKQNEIKRRPICTTQRNGCDRWWRWGGSGFQLNP